LLQNDEDSLDRKFSLFFSNTFHNKDPPLKNHYTSFTAAVFVEPELVLHHFWEFETEPNRNMAPAALVPNFLFNMY
jgi:hypothetical protein